MSRASALALHALHHFATRLVGGEAGNPLQALPLLLLQPVDAGGAFAQLLLALREGFLLPPELALTGPDFLQLLVQFLALLLGPPLEALKFVTTALQLLLGFLAQLEYVGLGRERCLGAKPLGLACRSGSHSLCIRVGAVEDALGAATLAASMDHHHDHAGKDAHDKPGADRYEQGRIHQRSP